MVPALRGLPVWRGWLSVMRSYNRGLTRTSRSAKPSLRRGHVSWGLEGDSSLDEEAKVFQAKGAARAKAQWQKSR